MTRAAQVRLQFMRPSGTSAIGAKQIDVMSATFQRTLSTADRVLNNLDKNPSRLIWGGSSPSAAAPKGRQ